MGSAFFPAPSPYTPAAPAQTGTLAADAQGGGGDGSDVQASWQFQKWVYRAQRSQESLASCRKSEEAGDIANPRPRKQGNPAPALRGRPRLPVAGSQSRPTSLFQPHPPEEVTVTPLPPEATGHGQCGHLEKPQLPHERSGTKTPIWQPWGGFGMMGAEGNRLDK